jgi:hypothetical protein
VEGAPVALFAHAPILVSYRSGTAEVVPKSVLRHDNHHGICFREFVDMVERGAKDYRPAWQPSTARKAPPRAWQAPVEAKDIDVTPYLGHPLNKAALALLKKHKRGGRELPAVMPVLELCLSTISQEGIESPKGMGYFLATLRDPKEILSYIEENVTPADLIEVDDLEVAGDMVLRRVLKLEFSDLPEFRAWDFY